MLPFLIPVMTYRGAQKSWKDPSTRDHNVASWRRRLGQQLYFWIWCWDIPKRYALSVVGLLIYFLPQHDPCSSFCFRRQGKAESNSPLVSTLRKAPRSRIASSLSTGGFFFLIMEARNMIFQHVQQDIRWNFSRFFQDNFKASILWLKLVAFGFDQKKCLMHLVILVKFPTGCTSS